jgi:hypothetical protein
MGLYSVLFTFLNRLDRCRLRHPDPQLSGQESQNLSISRRRGHLTIKIDKFRDTQHKLMPNVLDELDKNGNLLPEQENLLLPSHFYVEKNLPKQPDKSYSSLAAIEGRLREGYLWTTASKIQNSSKYIGSMETIKSTNVRGQAQNTRANQKIRAAYSRRRELIRDFNRHREALIHLGVYSTETVPHLTDSMCKPMSMDKKRALYSSRAKPPLPFILHKNDQSINSLILDNAPSNSGTKLDHGNDSGTQMVGRVSGK